EDAVDGRGVGGSEDVGQLGEVGMEEAHPRCRAGRSDAPAGELEVARVGIDADQEAAGAEPMCDGRRVPAAAERAVDDGLARLKIQPVERLPQEDGVVAAFRHAATVYVELAVAISKVRHNNIT